MTKLPKISAVINSSSAFSVCAATVVAGKARELLHPHDYVHLYAGPLKHLVLGKVSVRLHKGKVFTLIGY